jgi:hypothetical protein
MPQIRITRTSEYINCLRNYRIFLDDEFAGTIANGATRELEVSSGSHKLVLKIDWCSSPALHFEADHYNTLEFETGCFSGRYFLTPLMLLLFIACAEVCRVMDNPYSFLAVIPVFVIFGYYVTIGRKRYLKLEQTS